MDLQHLSERLLEQQAALKQQARDQNEERHRLDGQMALKQQLEHRCQLAIARQEAEKVERSHQEHAISKEMERLVIALEDQISWNGYAPAINDWKRRWEVEQEMRKAAQAAQANAATKEAEMNNKIADLELTRASYLACGITEHCIERFAKQSANPRYDDITTKKKQRTFTANMMKKIHYAKEVELLEELNEFGETRNNLCHDHDGSCLKTINHERFQSLCHRIQAVVRSM